MAVEVASMGIQIHGGMGYIEETGAAQHYRDAKIAAIYEGTNGIQAMDLAGRKLAMEGGKAFADLIEDIRQTVEDLSTSSDPALPELARQLDPACDTLAKAVQWMQRADDADRLTGATAFLKLVGDVTGGWLLCVGAVAARRIVKEGEGDLDHARARIALAGVYADTVLSSAPGLLGDVTVGAERLFKPGAGILESA
jgi:3-(methylthio)propanoyl-CoA dehydrogenase